jgi:hypothetical protein
LDSSLVEDTTQAMLQRLRTGVLPPRFASFKTMENAAQLLSTHTSGVDWTRVRGTEDYHQWAVLNFFQAVAPTSEF